MGTYKFKAFGLTDVGRRRSQNEDSFFSDVDMGLHFVADGMGGHAAGEVASGTAVNVISDFVQHYQTDNDITWPFGIDSSKSRAENLMISSIRLANQRICQKAIENPETKGMGTTVAALYVDEDDDLIIAHVGDSRVYRFRGDELECLTTDHTWVNEQLQRNIITEEEARNHRWKNVITRALGNREELEVDIQKVQVQDEDLLLVCSDGLTTMLEDEEVREVLLKADLREGLEKIATELIEMANEKGGYDNISVILVECNNPNETPTLSMVKYPKEEETAESDEAASDNIDSSTKISDEDQERLKQQAEKMELPEDFNGTQEIEVTEESEEPEEK